MIWHVKVITVLCRTWEGSGIGGWSNEYGLKWLQGWGDGPVASPGPLQCLASQETPSTPQMDFNFHSLHSQGMVAGNPISVFGADTKPDLYG